MCLVPDQHVWLHFNYYWFFFLNLLVHGHPNDTECNFFNQNKTSRWNHSVLHYLHVTPTWLHIPAGRSIPVHNGFVSLLFLRNKQGRTFHFFCFSCPKSTWLMNRTCIATKWTEHEFNIAVHPCITNNDCIATILYCHIIKGATRSAHSCPLIADCTVDHLHGGKKEKSKLTLLFKTLLSWASLFSCWYKCIRFTKRWLRVSFCFPL